MPEKTTLVGSEITGVIIVVTEANQNKGSSSSRVDFVGGRVALLCAAVR